MNNGRQLFDNGHSRKRHFSLQNVKENVHNGDNLDLARFGHHVKSESGKMVQIETKQKFDVSWRRTPHVPWP